MIKTITYLYRQPSITKGQGLGKDDIKASQYVVIIYSIANYIDKLVIKLIIAESRNTPRQAPYSA
jgi:hypothetical protein